MTAPDHEQAERIAHVIGDAQGDSGLQSVNLARAYLDLATQLAEAQASQKALHGLIDTLHTEKRELKAQLAERERLLRRLREWDDLPGRADGPYWIAEVDRVLAATRSDSEERG